MKQYNASDQCVRHRLRKIPLPNVRLWKVNAHHIILNGSFFYVLFLFLSLSLLFSLSSSSFWLIFIAVHSINIYTYIYVHANREVDGTFGQLTKIEQLLSNRTIERECLRVGCKATLFWLDITTSRKHWHKSVTKPTKTTAATTTTTTTIAPTKKPNTHTHTKAERKANWASKWTKRSQPFWVKISLLRQSICLCTIWLCGRMETKNRTGSVRLWCVHSVVLTSIFCFFRVCFLPPFILSHSFHHHYSF